VRVRLDPALVRRRARRASPVSALSSRTGTRFLLAKKRERDVAREVLRAGRAAVEAAWEELVTLAEATRRRPAAELDGTRVALDAALLVEAAREARLKQAMRRVARVLAAHGYRLTMTGPWPAYNFVSDGR
jgi:hypothetical protein